MEPMYRALSGSPALDANVCCVTERAAKMGSTTAKSLSASSCECCRHWLHTSRRATSEKGLMGKVHRVTSIYFFLYENRAILKSIKHLSAT